MPKGHVAEREVACKACGLPFSTTKVGRAAFYCHRPECDALRPGSSRPESAVTTKARLRHRALFDPIRRNHEAMLMVDEIVEVALTAPAKDGSRLEVKRAVMRLADAEGLEGQRQAALDLAAASLALAAKAPSPRAPS